MKNKRLRSHEIYIGLNFKLQKHELVQICKLKDLRVRNSQI